MAINDSDLKKSGFIRQVQKEYFSLRIKVVGGNLSADKLKTVSEVAEKYGKGYVHFTSRQSVEIPFIRYEDIESVKEELAKGDCQPGAIGPRVRTITACQGKLVCQSGCIDPFHIAQELDQRYIDRELPHKFKIGITGCKNNCLKAEENDLGIKGGYEVTWKQDSCVFCGLCEKACRYGAIKMEEDQILFDPTQCTNCGRCVKVCPTDAWTGEEGYLVSFGGLYGNEIHKGSQFLPLIKKEEQLYLICDRAIDFFAEHGKQGERFKYTMDRYGKEAFKQYMEEVI